MSTIERPVGAKRGEAMGLLAGPAKGPVPLDEVAVRLHPEDAVAIAKVPLLPRTVLAADDGEVRVGAMIPPGHKVALRAVAEGEPVRKYGQIIGFATRPIAPGAHVHSHNLAVGEGQLTLDYAFASERPPVAFVPEAERRTFLGFRRADGRVGTRNYVGILASVNCSSSATRAIADHFKRPGALAAYPNVDGVVPFPTKGGCGAHYGSSDLHLLQRTMAGIVDHPNVGAYVILSLGCEVNQPEDLIGSTSLGQGAAPTVLTIQQDGGFAETVKAGIAAVETLLPEANEATREPVPVSELVVALQCGGSDAWSGVTANPGLGLAADEVVRQGGTVVLSETTEVYGGEHLLTRRAKDRAVGEALVERIHWWERYTALFGASIDNNPAPGNKLGGLTTIYEKSLGAIAKAGNTPLNQVVGYGERVTERGFVHMDTPGYDPVAVTGQVAGGCNLVVFTTGRGSAFGFKPAPSLKLATNSELYRRQEPDMDVNCGQVLDGMPLEQLGQEIFEEMVAVASGKKTKSELAGVGEEEFNPWVIGAML
ncbi:MAG: Altronate dehydratase [uncultured Thermomicrobiales bacterium]|uniref:Altronate dehydratase n=1 Tax=uncultured Thermomicrobiales bacterium TaxID=1645740 RepID=A0A6J4UZQ4_9BACT|nr:MAG: Altronate dehydratase [uncultured Thermomicrobiales bacterium]